MGGEYLIRHESGRFLAAGGTWAECPSDALRLSDAEARVWRRLSCEAAAVELVDVESLLVTAGC